MKEVTEAKLSCMLKDALHSELSHWKPLSLTHDVRNGTQAVTRVYETSLCWLLELNCKLHFYPECFCLAVSLLDRFLGCVKVQPRHLNCAAVACFVLAIKVTEEDTEIPRIDYVIKMMLSISQGISKLSVSEVVRMEAIILDKLSWNINPVTALHFLQIFHAMSVKQTQHQNQRAAEPAHPATLVAVDRDRRRCYSAMASPARQLATASAKLMRFMCNAEACAIKPSVVALSVLSLELTASSTLSLSPPPALSAEQQSSHCCWPFLAAKQLSILVGAPALGGAELERGLSLVEAALYCEPCRPNAGAVAARSDQSIVSTKNRLQHGDSDRDQDFSADDLESGASGSCDFIKGHFEGEQ